ncbi:MAG: prepilin-type N-terminal cleavage/methylation domain-containing protein [Fibrobacteria bacterium]
MRRLPGRPAAQPVARGQEGFSLLEILISAVVTLLLATSAFYFLHSQNSVSAQGNDLMKGVNLGKLKLDSLKVSAYDDLTSGSDTVSERYIRAWHISPVTDSMGLPTGRKEIGITIQWPLTALHTVTLVTLKSDDHYKEETP